MDDFGDNFIQPDIDPAAEFLAREQNQLAGLEDELETTAPPPILNTSEINEIPETNGVSDEETQYPQISSNAAREEPEKIRIWREEQKKRLEEKDAEEEQKRKEWLAIAKKELEDWYKTHNEQIAKIKASNRNAEKALAKTAEGVEEGGEWARVAELCDFGRKGERKGRDVARLRSLVLQLKQNGMRPKYPPRKNVEQKVH